MKLKDGASDTYSTPAQGSKGGSLRNATVKTISEYARFTDFRALLDLKKFPDTPDSLTENQDFLKRGATSG